MQKLLYVPRPAPRRAAGFTLLEMAAVLAIATIFAAIAIPTYKDTMAKYRMEGERKGLRDNLQIAHNDSFGETELTICASSNGTSCSTGKHWQMGHILFVDEGVIGKVDGGDVVLERVLSARAGYTIVATEEASSNDYTAGFVHFVDGKPDLKKSLRFTVCNKGAMPDRISINLTGHMWSTKGTTPCA